MGKEEEMLKMTGISEKLKRGMTISELANWCSNVSDFINGHNITLYDVSHVLSEEPDQTAVIRIFIDGEQDGKQIPKKPLYKHYEEVGKKPYVKICCPNGCRIQLSPVTKMQFAHEHVYCPKCGQKIDWTDWEWEVE